MFTSNTTGNPNIGFFRYSSNNNHNFINKNKLNKNNPYIGYFSQYNNKKFINNNLFSNIKKSWYPYYKANPFIISRLIPSLGTNIILYDETNNQPIQTNYFYNHFYKSYLNSKSGLTYSETESINTERETNESIQTNNSIDEITQTESEMSCTSDKEVQTDDNLYSNLYDSVDLYYKTHYNSKLLYSVDLSDYDSDDNNIFLKDNISNYIKNENEENNKSDESDKIEENDSDYNNETEDSLEDEYVLIN